MYICMCMYNYIHIYIYIYSYLYVICFVLLKLFLFWQCQCDAVDRSRWYVSNPKVKRVFRHTGVEMLAVYVSDVNSVYTSAKIVGARASAAAGIEGLQYVWSNTMPVGYPIAADSFYHGSHRCWQLLPWITSLLTITTMDPIAADSYYHGSRPNAEGHFKHSAGLQQQALTMNSATHRWMDWRPLQTQRCFTTWMRSGRTRLKCTMPTYPFTTCLLGRLRLTKPFSWISCQWTRPL